MAFSHKRGDNTEKDTSFCDLVDTEMFKGLTAEITNLDALVNNIIMARVGK